MCSQYCTIKKAALWMQSNSQASPDAEASPASSQEPRFGFNISQLERASHSRTFWAVEPPLPISEPPTTQQLNRNSRFVPLCFDNGEACYRDIRTADILRSISVFNVCGLSWLVKRADYLYQLSNTLLGWTGAPNFVIRHTFFRHFCAGEDQQVCPLHCSKAFSTHDSDPRWIVYTKNGLKSGIELDSKKFIESVDRKDKSF
jgi:hypothetical protein